MLNFLSLGSSFSSRQINLKTFSIVIVMCMYLRLHVSIEHVSSGHVYYWIIKIRLMNCESHNLNLYFQYFSSLERLMPCVWGNDAHIPFDWFWRHSVQWIISFLSPIFVAMTNSSQLNSSITSLSAINLLSVHSLN